MAMGTGSDYVTMTTAKVATGLTNAQPTDTRTLC